MKIEPEQEIRKCHEGKKQLDKVFTSKEQQQTAKQIQTNTEIELLEDDNNEKKLSIDTKEIVENDIQSNARKKPKNENTTQVAIDLKRSKEADQKGTLHVEEAVNESSFILSQDNTNNTDESTEHPKQVLGEYVNVSSYDELLKVLDDYYHRTATRFISTVKSKGFGTLGVNADTVKHKIYWKDSEVPGTPIKNYCLPYDGIPRVVVANCIFACHQGNARGHTKKEEHKQKRKKNMENYSSKKCGCPTKIYIRQIIKFPEFKIPCDTAHRRRATADKLKKRLKENIEDLKTELVFSLRLPDISEHLYHTIEKEENMKKEMVHKELSVLAKNLYLNKFGSNADIWDALKDHVLNNMFYKQPPPNPNHRRYFPSLTDVRGMLTNIRIVSRCSIEQEEHLTSLINKLKSNDESLNIFFNVSVRRSTECTSDDEFFEPDLHENKAKSSKNKRKSTKPKKPSEIRTYIICFQTFLQQRLLKRFGNIAFLSQVLIEDTSIKKAIPFHVYNVLVQTSVDFQTIGCIIVSREQDSGLIDGLNCLKDWNTYWRPKYFIVDCSDDIYEAVDTVFPECQYFLAPHSCRRKWKEFLDTPSNELSGYSEEILTHLKKMEYCYTEDSLSIAAALFEGCDAWQKSTVLRTWFQTTWLHIAKKWVFGYQPEDLILTNHLDISIVDCLKNYEQLLLDFVGSKNCVANFLEKAVQFSIVEDYKRYVATSNENYQCCKKFLLKNPPTECFQGLPDTMIPFVYDIGKLAGEHCFEISHNNLGLFTVKYDEDTDPDMNIEREETTTTTGCCDALAICNNITNKTVEHLQAGEFTVSFGDLENFPFCTCSFWQMYKLPCVHMFKIFSQVPEWKYDMLSPLYRSLNVFHPDYSCLNFVSNTKCEEKSTQTAAVTDKQKGDRLFKSLKKESVSAQFPLHCKGLLHHLEKIAFMFQDKTFFKNLTENISSVKDEAEEVLPRKKAVSSDVTTDFYKKNSMKSTIVAIPTTKLSIPPIDLSQIDTSADSANALNTATLINKSPRLQSALKLIAERNPNANIKLITPNAAKGLVKSGQTVFVLNQPSSSDSGNKKPDIVKQSAKNVPQSRASNVPLEKPLVGSRNTDKELQPIPTLKCLNLKSTNSESSVSCLAVADSAISDTIGSTEPLSAKVSGIEDVTILSILPKLSTKNHSQVETECSTPKLLPVAAVNNKSKTYPKTSQAPAEISPRDEEVSPRASVQHESLVERTRSEPKLSFKRKSYDLRGSAPSEKKCKRTASHDAGLERIIKRLSVAPNGTVPKNKRTSP